MMANEVHWKLLVSWRHAASVHTVLTSICFGQLNAELIVVLGALDDGANESTHIALLKSAFAFWSVKNIIVHLHTLLGKEMI